MDFVRNDILSITIVSIIIFFVIYFGYVNIYRNIKNIGNKNLSYNLNIKLYILKSILYILGIVILMFSYLGPILGINGDLNKVMSSEIIFVLDGSKSMDSKDIPNEKNISRLDFAKKIISNYISTENQNNYSLIVFAGSALSVSPSTNDTDWFLANLDSVNTNLVKQGGTNISYAIKEAIGDEKNTKKRNIIILSDGENINGEDEYKYLKEFNDKIKIFTVGIGSEKGGYIPTGEDFLGNQNFKMFEGEKVITKLNEDSLINISNIGNGMYLKGNNIDVLYGFKNKLILNNLINSDIVKKEYDNGYYFAIISLIFLFGGYIIKDKINIGKK